MSDKKFIELTEKLEEKFMAFMDAIETSKTTNIEKAFTSLNIASIAMEIYIFLMKKEVEQK